MTMSTERMTVGVVGAGAMGAGIAQVAAQAGHPVLVYDAFEGAAANGVARIASGLDGLVQRGKMTAGIRDGIVSRIHVVDDLTGLAEAGLVVEAIVEDLAVKQQLFGTLETLVTADCILATNTSSLSVTAIAAPLRHPGRVAGFHFFNPAPIMKLVEVISGAATAPAIADTLLSLAQAWGKIAVPARSTPGFIVNRVARPFYGETLRLIEEGAADAATLDAILTEAGGFRMGPCALMDLIGHDVNYAVTKSTFDAYAGDPRYRPSLVQKELIDAGWLGRKSGRGFYTYGAGDQPAAAQKPAQAALALDGSEHTIAGTILRRTDGRTAVNHAAAAEAHVVLYDLVANPVSSPRVAISHSPGLEQAALDTIRDALAEGGRQVTVLKDRPGLAVMRTLAMLANEAFEAFLHGVASLDAIDQAMLYGVNYPRGPVAWAREIGLRNVLATLDNLQAATGDPRYRASLALRLAVDAEQLQRRVA